MTKYNHFLDLILPFSILVCAISLLLCLPLENSLVDPVFQLLSFTPQEQTSSSYGYSDSFEVKLFKSFKSFRAFTACNEISTLQNCTPAFLIDFKEEVISMGGPQDEDKFTSLLKCIKKTGKFHNQEIGIDVAYCMKNYDQFDETESEDQNKEEDQKEEENSSSYKILLPIFIVTLVCQLLGVHSNETDLSNDPLTEETRNILKHELDGIEEAPIQKPCLCVLPEISKSSSEDLTNHDAIGLLQSVSQLTVKEAVSKIERDLQNLTSNEHIEPTSAKLILKVGGEEYNLKSKEDLQRWKERTFALKPSLNGSLSLPTEMSHLLPESSNHLSNTLRSISSSSSASITIVTSAKAKSANCIDNISNEFKFDENSELDTAECDQKEFRGDNENLRKARTDINIHDPLKPIPTALEHPIVDKNGKKLKRIFIPGRGWVASKVLESEKQELYGLISNVSTD